jgi:hypothetical protein
MEQVIIDIDNNIKIYTGPKSGKFIDFDDKGETGKIRIRDAALVHLLYKPTLRDFFKNGKGFWGFLEILGWRLALDGLRRSYPELFEIAEKSDYDNE